MPFVSKGFRTALDIIIILNDEPFKFIRINYFSLSRDWFQNTFAINAIQKELDSIINA